MALKKTKKQKIYCVEKHLNTFETSDEGRKNYRVY